MFSDYSVLSKDDIQAVAKRTVAILEARGLPCCLMGSAASALWGTRRTPNDIDVVVMSTAYDQERIKQLIVAVDSTYYLVPSKNRRNTYKVLWNHVSGRSGVTCKVDVLVPPTLNIPLMDGSRVVWSAGIPTMPLFALLLLKLQGWQDHRQAPIRRTDLRAKQHVDVLDIQELLEIAEKHGVSLASEKQWLPNNFLQVAERRVILYIRTFPASQGAWEKLGFKSHYLSRTV